MFFSWETSEWLSKWLNKKKLFSKNFWSARLFIGNDKKEETGESVRTNKLKMKKQLVLLLLQKFAFQTYKDKIKFVEQNEEIKH